MKKLLLSTFLISSTFATVFSQYKTYAITSEKQGEFQWTAIREIDFNSGEFTKTLISNSTKQNMQLRSNNSTANSSNFISGRGVAAAAFDALHNRLYFSEMYGNDLKYIDLNNSTSTDLSVAINSNINYSTGAKNYDESNIITRMAFSKDGSGYALTNDANMFIKFTTDANPQVFQLGALKDSKKNNSISIHNQCTSWGGDLVGDDYGNLYLISMRNNVFKINIGKLEAEFVGVISGLPASFTTNGAAADDNGNIILSSASVSDSYFRVNPSTLVASSIKGGAEMYSVSDLANSNLIYQRKSSTVNNNFITLEDNVSVYPNPVTNNKFTVNFNNVNPGNYTMELADINGKVILNKNVNINGVSNEKLALNNSTVGVYLLRLIDVNGKTSYTKKIVVE